MMRTLTRNEEFEVVGGDGVSCVMLSGGGEICASTAGSTLVQTILNSAGEITQATTCTQNGTAQAQLSFAGIAGRMLQGSISGQNGGGVTCTTINFNGSGRPADAKSWLNWIFSQGDIASPAAVTYVSGIDTCVESGFGYNPQSLATFELKGVNN